MHLLFITIVPLFALAALLSGLRSGFYALHMVLVVAGMQAAGRLWPGAESLDNAQLIAMCALLHMLSINLLTYSAYARDKRASQRGTWRVPERTLHHLALAGGTLAALLAQKRLRHKTRKQSFRRMFWAIALLQLTALAGLLGYIAANYPA